MASLAAALKAELRRQAARETRKALRSLQRLRKQVGDLRLVNRSQLRAVKSLKRRFERLKTRVAKAGGRVARRISGGLPGRPVTPQSIRGLRGRLGLSRALFAKLLGVSPGSIFGWENGRAVPRGSSRTRLAEVRKMGLRAARKLVAPAGKRRAARGRGRKRGGRRARGRS
jgi:DNA-binding XRE family transcriptional regulator